MSILPSPLPAVVVIEADEDLRDSLCTLLGMEGFQSLPARDASEGWALLTDTRPAPQVVLLDADLPREGAADFLTRWRTQGPGWAPVILLAESRAQARQERLRDATTALMRPIRTAALLARIRRVMGRQRARPRPSVPRTLDLPLAGAPPHPAR